MKKKTLVMGASPDPERYAFKAAVLLGEHDHPVVLFGKRKGEIMDNPILNAFPAEGDFDTVTLYLNPDNQQKYIEPILQLKPKRVIFNPGTENPEFEDRLKEQGIDALEACTLVLLHTGQY